MITFKYYLDSKTSIPETLQKGVQDGPADDGLCFVMVLLLMLACKVQGAELTVSLFGIKPGYEFICLVFATSSQVEDRNLGN